jgi:molecular chaperone HtpG
LKPEVKNTQLYKWLNAKDNALAGRMLHIREELLKWMPYVAQLFPHYPSHAVDHSDRIIVQLSRLLFNNTKPVVKFSTSEVYCLLCAAYLHDMGMVVSPGDTATILASDQWRKFVAPDGKGHELFQRYVELRERPIVETEELSAFLAGQALRYLIADFVRRDHHERGKNTLELHPPLRRLVDDGDSVAFETIADVGVAHGLQENDLADESRFPEERDVFGGKVNVRFLARLLRIGDLLDMSSKRADPTTARAIGPLPSDAVPHWQQYSAKKHENITPKIIEFTFECKDQDAHRVLRDWFGWLEAEVRAAGLEQLHAARHNNWKAPQCLVSSQASAGTRGSKQKATVVIKPAANAKYTFHDWKLELDHDLVLQRLIHEVYDNPAVFVRELIQNALDATRCQMYADFALQHPDATAPERPTLFDRDFRERYLVSISFSQEEVQLSPDGPRERRAVFTIEDRGSGMSEEIIRRYFLQVGRSYYQSSEFRERYKFAPTSRFGIGFLSVFAVSKDITVDTARRDDNTGKVTGIRLRLREPRNFLLTEPWAPFEDRITGSRTGTRIRVVLNDWPMEMPFVTLVRRWCVAVEVPILVKDTGAETIVRTERLTDRAVLASGQVDPAARFILRAFDINSGGVEGQVAVIAYDDAMGEGWCDCWPDDRDLGGDRLERLPKLDLGYTALHGVKFGDAPIRSRSRGSQWIQRSDVRSGAATSPLTRLAPEDRLELELISRPRRRGDSHSRTTSLAVSAVELTTRAAVERHLADSPRVKHSRGIYYIGNVLSGAPLSDAWRDQFPGTVATWQCGNRLDISVAELLALNEIVVSAWTVPDRISRQPRAPMNRHPREIASVVPIVSLSDTPGFCNERFVEKINGMSLIGAESSEDLWLFRFSATETHSEFYRGHSESRSWVVPIDLEGAAVLECDFLGRAGTNFYILDRKHPVMRWLCVLRERSQNDPANIKAEHVDAAWLAASTAWYKMDDLLSRWNNAPNIPPELKPPGDNNGGVLRFYYKTLITRPTVPLDSNKVASKP